MDRRKAMKEIGHKLFFVGTLLVLSGCVSMESVKNYSTYSRTTIESVKPIAKDFQTSCLRANSYKPLKAYSKCNSEQEASKSILIVASVLDAYGAALGALASDELASYNTQTDDLKGELIKLKVADEPKIKAVGNLSSLIANAVTKTYQQKEIVKFIKESDDSVISVSNALADIIEQNYVQAISYEISAWEDAYKRVEIIERDAKPLEWEAYSKTQWQQRSDLEAKQAAAISLAKNIRNIGETHHKLKEDANELSSKEVYAIVRNFVDTSKPVIKDVKEAFADK